MPENWTAMASAEIEGSSGSPFEHFLETTFGPDLGPRFPSPLVSRGVFLCFVNRSGSNYFARCLAASGNFPRARECFLKANLRKQAAASAGGSISEAFEAIVERQRAGECFAAKLGLAQLEFFHGRGFLDGAFEDNRFLFLVRQDTVAQAVSLEIASQTQSWKADGEEGGAATITPEYSRKRIALKQVGIEKKYHRFEAYFKRQGLAPLTIHFEDLVRDPAEVVRRAGEFLDLPISFDSGGVDDQIAPDPLKKSWRRRFLEGD